MIFIFIFLREGGKEAIKFQCSSFLKIFVQALCCVFLLVNNAFLFDYLLKIYYMTFFYIFINKFRGID